MKTWVKLYTESNRDRDLASLTWAQRGIWAALLCLAGELDHRNGDDEETGRLDTLANVAWHLRCDIAELGAAIDAFVERGMVHGNDGILFLTNYPKRQARPPSAKRKAVAKRVKRHRGKDVTTLPPAGCNEDVTSLQRECNEDVTTLDTDTEEDTDTEKNTEGEKESPKSFAVWRDELEKAKNKPALLVDLFKTLYPGRDPPAFGYVGRIAREVGGPGRLAELLWQNSTRPPSGDILAYVRQVAKGRAKPGTRDLTDGEAYEGWVKGNADDSAV